MVAAYLAADAGTVGSCPEVSVDYPNHYKPFTIRESVPAQNFQEGDRFTW